MLQCTAAACGGARRDGASKRFARLLFLGVAVFSAPIIAAHAEVDVDGSVSSDANDDGALANDANDGASLDAAIADAPIADGRVGDTGISYDANSAADACNQTTPLCCKIGQPCAMGDDSGSTPANGCACSMQPTESPLPMAFVPIALVVLLLLRGRQRRR